MGSYILRAKRSLRGCTFKPSLRILLMEEGFLIDLFGFLLPLTFMNRWAWEPDEIMESWGPHYFESGFWWTWGGKSWCWYAPWFLEHYSTEVVDTKGNWVPYKPDYNLKEGEVGDNRAIEIHPYRYILRSGEVQERTATFYVRRMTWRRRWLWWTKMFGFTRTTIDVQFSDEVGERTGSWKGGCVGCGYDINPGETPLQTLRRMEAERKFN